LTLKKSGPQQRRPTHIDHLKNSVIWPVLARERSAPKAAYLSFRDRVVDADLTGYGAAVEQIVLL